MTPTYSMESFAVKAFANCFELNRETRKSFHPRKIPAIRYANILMQHAAALGHTILLIVRNNNFYQRQN